MSDRLTLDLELFEPFCDAMQLKVFERKRLARELESLAAPVVLSVADPAAAAAMNAPGEDVPRWSIRLQGGMFDLDAD